MPEVSTKQKEVQKKLEVERWRMPEPKSGLVSWRAQEGQGDHLPALVVQKTRDTLNVMVFSASGNFRMYEGARHKSDPSLIGRTEANPGGIWDFTEFEATVARLASQLM